MAYATSESKEIHDHVVLHDGVAHHPLGAGSYVFQQKLVNHLNSYCDKDNIKIHIGAQPNSSPHVGTIVNFATAFCLGARLIRDCNRKVIISLDLVDTAPSEQLNIDGITYQKSLTHTGEMSSYLDDFCEVLEKLKDFTKVDFQIRRQSEFLDNPNMPGALQAAVAKRAEIAPAFSPLTQTLGIRAACPYSDCGLADKHGVKNEYSGSTVTFVCPHHGRHSLDMAKREDVCKMEFNTPMRNILRAEVFALDKDNTWIHLPGADYAGYYQEQLLWRFLSQPLLIFYSPVIVDWSGAKLSKSMYVQTGAYNYLCQHGMEYLVSYKVFKAEGKDINALCEEVADWVEHPYKLFRAYSIAYIDSLFRKAV